jgi:hypothetical protein
MSPFLPLKLLNLEDSSNRMFSPLFSKACRRLYRAASSKVEDAPVARLRSRHKQNGVLLAETLTMQKWLRQQIHIRLTQPQLC